MARVTAELVYRLGWPPEYREVIDAEVSRAAARLPRWGATTRDDLQAVALEAAWDLKRRRPEAGGGYLRLRVRHVLWRALIREWRALGLVKRTVRWPWYRPLVARPRVTPPFRLHRCRECGERIPDGEQPNRVWCTSCAGKRRLVQQREYNRTYYRRRQAAGAAA